jgi:hypothetical protein
MNSHHEETFYSYTVTGKMFYTYPITGFFFYFYPITENDHNYSYPITGKYSIHMPSQENVQIHNPSRESFIFISRDFSVSLFVVFVFQSRFKNSYWNDLKQLDYTDLNELAKKLPIIAKSSKSAKMCLHKEIQEFILPITGKNYTCIHIPSRENILFIYRHRIFIIILSQTIEISSIRFFSFTICCFCFSESI